MKIEITYEMDDWLKYQSWLQNDISGRIKMPWQGFWSNVLVLTVAMLIVMAVLPLVGGFHWPTAGFVAVIGLCLLAYLMYFLHQTSRGYAPSQAGPFIGSHRFQFNDSGIATEGEGYNGFHTWSLVKRIIRDNGLIMIFVDSAFAFIFPEQKLDDPDGFFAYIQEKCPSPPDA